MMFDREEPARQKGKKTSGFTTRKDGQFSLGWDAGQQMNQYQAKKMNRNQGTATKVTQNQPTQNKQPMTFEDKCRQLIEENPDITTDELQERMALWEVSANQPQQQPTAAGVSKPATHISSTKGAIFGSEDAVQVPSSKRTSRRNEGTFSFGEYNYFKEDNRK